MTWIRAYGLLLRFFPPDFRRQDRDDATRLLRALLDDVGSPTERSRLILRCFVRLPWAVARDWGSYLTDSGRRASGTTQPNMAMRLLDLRSFRHALRSLWKAPAFTWTTVLLIALGVGAVTTIFTLVDHVLLRPLPYPDADRLVTVENGSHSGPLFREMETLASVERWAAGTNLDVNLIGEGRPQRLAEARVSSDFFDLLGAVAQRGRLLDGPDFAVTNRVVVSAGAWRRIWGEDPSLVGRSIEIDGDAATVVGVLSAEFQPPEAIVGESVDIWRPIDWANPQFDSHERWALEVVGRLRDGASPADADTETQAMMTRMAGVHENYTTDDGTPRAIPVVSLAESTVRGVRSGLGLLMGAVGLLLLVACANVAHLFLARGLARRREMGIRRALGAPTSSLVGQLAAESLVVGAAGGIGGLALAAIGLRTFLSLNPEALPRGAEVGLDLRVLGFAALLSVATTLVFGLLPATRAIGRGHDAVAGGTRAATSGRGAAALRRGLIVAEVALSLVLVASAGLLLRTFAEVRSQDPGLDVEGVVTIPLTPRGITTPAEYRTAMDEVRESLARVPGVRSADYGLTVPLERVGGSRCCWRTNVRGPDDGSEVTPWFHPVSAGFIDTFGIPLLHGRGWTDAEATATPIPVVANEELARQLFGSAESALNRRFTRGEGERAWSMIITGVTVNTRYYGLDAPPEPAAYIPIEFLPFPSSTAHMAVKVLGSDPGLPTRLREAVWAAAPALPVPVVRPMEEWLNRDTAQRRFDTALFGSFGLIALLLSAGGLYGTLLYIARQRRRELAIRLALGASKRRIERWMLSGGMAVAGAGVVFGLLGSWGAARLLESRLWGVDRTDPTALLGAAGILLTVACLASWLPARWAGQTDPLEALNAE